MSSKGCERAIELSAAAQLPTGRMNSASAYAHAEFGVPVIGVAKNGNGHPGRAHPARALRAAAVHHRRRDAHALRRADAPPAPANPHPPRPARPFTPPTDWGARPRHRAAPQRIRPPRSHTAVSGLGRQTAATLVKCTGGARMRTPWPSRAGLRAADLCGLGEP
jgi:hypothetical protein